MDIQYNIFNAATGERYDIPQEEAKYAFENLQLGNIFWTTDDYWGAGTIVDKILRVKKNEALLIISPDTKKLRDHVTA